MESKTNILLIGGGGNCKSVIEAIESQEQFQIFGIIDTSDKVGQCILGYFVVGTDKDLPRLLAETPAVLITVGQLKSATVRIKLFKKVKALGSVFPVIIASSAIVSKHAKIGEGTVIMHQAVVNAGAEIGVNAIVNTAAVIEHDTKIGNHCHISTGAVVNGGCRIGNEVLVGSCAVLKQGVKVENNVIIGAGSVVLKDVGLGKTIVGNPAKVK